MSPAAERKYVLDTNVFVRAFRDPAANAELQRFHQLFAPFEYLSVVVAQELRAGARSAADRKALERNVLEPYARRGRVVTPSTRAWHESGDLLAELAHREELEPRVSKSFGNDILLALSCREQGLVLVTDNRRDFDRIARVAAFDFVEPWPAPSPLTRPRVNAHKLLRSPPPTVRTPPPAHAGGASRAAPGR